MKSPLLQKRTSFSDDELNELEMLLVYLQLIGMGRFFHYYGDADDDGDKSGCLIQYENVGLDARSTFGVRAYCQVFLI